MADVGYSDCQELGHNLMQAITRQPRVQEQAGRPDDGAKGVHSIGADAELTQLPRCH